jgi:hypothetical protein
MYQWHSRGMPCTAALRRALAAVHGPAIASDLLFLEAWEMDPTPDISAIFRVRQTRRANPALPPRSVPSWPSALREPRASPRAFMHDHRPWITPEWQGEPLGWGRASGESLNELRS